MKRYLRPHRVLSINQALQYAVACTMSTAVAGLMSLYYPLSTPLFLCFILSSACFVYFSYGTHLLTQTLMIVTGSVITCVCVCLSIFISPMIVMSFVFLILISCLCYFYSSLNIGCLFIAKLNLVFISFAITGVFSDHACPILHAGVAILAGGTIAMGVNALLYGVAKLVTSRNILNDWHNTLLAQLQQLAAGYQPENFEKIIQDLDQYKLVVSSYDLSSCLLVEHISHALLKYAQLIKAQPIIMTTFSKPIQQLLKTLSEALIQSDDQMVRSAIDDFNHTMSTLKTQGYFQNTPLAMRKSYAECIFLLNQLAMNLERYTNHDASQTVHHPNKLSRYKAVLKAFKQHKIFELGRLSIASKIAIRAAITLPLSYAVALVFHINHPGWVLLSANLVLLVRKGDTIKKAFDRILGHVVGAILSLPLAYYVWLHFYSAYFWTPVLAFLSAYYFLKNYFIYALLLMILLVYMYGMRLPMGFVGLPVEPFILSRLIAVTVGCVVAMTAGLFIFHDTGSTPLLSAHHQMLGLFNQLLRRLKFGNKYQDFNLYQTIKLQLAENITLYKGLFFQPDRYNYHQRTQSMLIHLEVDMTTNLSSLSRRMKGIGKSLLSTPLLMEHIDRHLEQASIIVAQLASLIVLLQKRERVVVTDSMIEKVNALEIDIEKTMAEVFLLSDDKAIDYFNLINFQGVVFAIQRLTQTLHHYCAQHRA